MCPYFPFRSRKRCQIVVGSALVISVVLLLFTSGYFGSESDRSLENRFQDELRRRAKENLAKEVDKLKDTLDDEVAMFKAFDVFDPNEVTDEILENEMMVLVFTCNR